MKKLDATNRKILEILQGNGSITNSDLAGIIGLSTASTLERVKKLESNGFITRYVALIDPEKVGKGLTAFMEISIADHSSEALDVFMNSISEIPEILECHHITGEKDYISADSFCDKTCLAFASGNLIFLFELVLLTNRFLRIKEFSNR